MKIPYQILFPININMSSKKTFYDHQRDAGLNYVTNIKSKTYRGLVLIWFVKLSLAQGQWIKSI